MSSPLAIYKLIILYMLDRADGEIAMDHLSEFLLENGFANFVSLLQSFAEIEENGLVSSKGKGDRQVFRITDEGRQTLRMFRGELNEDIRSQADAFLREKGRVLREEQNLLANYYAVSDGSYEVMLSVHEHGRVLFEVRINVPDKAQAQKICMEWPEKNEEIYSCLIEKLF